ncbi:hypothetical protein ART_3147 [Arthrobacter sp. PAMC 25486]|nr:hypothetical protein ART_3147 [Arthrobacter sp. PAMC 25486]
MLKRRKNSTLDVKPNLEQLMSNVNQKWGYISIVMDSQPKK